MIPLAGQGITLPSDSPYEGEWLLENRLFLYRPKDQRILGGKSAEMTAGFQRPDGEWCVGFNSMVLAWELGIGSEEIFALNRLRLLTLESVEEVAPTMGGTKAKRYTFAARDKLASLTIEAGPEGNA